jgi:hypothetical protein
MVIMDRKPLLPSSTILLVGIRMHKIRKISMILLWSIAVIGVLWLSLVQTNELNPNIWSTLVWGIIYIFGSIIIFFIVFERSGWSFQFVRAFGAVIIITSIVWLFIPSNCCYLVSAFLSIVSLILGVLTTYFGQEGMKKTM